MAIGQLLVEFIGSTARFQEDLGRATAATEAAARRMERSMRSVTAPLDEIKSRINGVINTLGALSGGAISTAGAIAAFDALKAATIESEQSALQLNAAIKATGGAAGETISYLNELGRSIKASTTFSTEDITKSETALLRFRDIRKEVFDEAIKDVPDLAVALGLSLPEAAAKLGRALEDPTKGMRGLKEAGVALTETQLALAIHFSQLGDKAQSQKIILDAVTASTRGAALAATEGLSGATDKLARSFKDLETASGKKLFGENHDLLAGMQKLFEDLTKRVDDASFSLTKWLENTAKVAVSPAFGGAFLGGIIGGALAPDTSAQRTAKGTISGQNAGDLSIEQDQARQTALDADIARRIDARTITQFNSLKSFAEKSAAFYASDTVLQKSSLTIQQSQLDFFYSQGEISAGAYYGSVASLARQAQQNIEAALGKRGAAEEAILLRSQFSNEADRNAALGRLAGIAGEGVAARVTLREKLLGLSQQEVLAIRKLADEYGTLGASIAEAAGRSGDAATARFDIANRSQRKQFEQQASSFDPLSAALGQFALDAQASERKVLQVQGDINDAQRKYVLILDDVAVKQGRIDLLQQTGQLTEIEAITQKGAAAQARIAQLTGELAKYASIANDPTLAAGPIKDAAILKVEQMRLEIDKLAAQSDVLSAKFRDVFVGSSTTFLTDLISGTKTARQSVIDLGKSLDQSISQIAAKDISERVFGKSGSLGSIPDLLAKWFGGGSATAAGQVPGDAFLPGALGAGGAASTAAALTLVDAPAIALAASLTIAAAAADAFAVSAAAGTSAASSVGSYASALAAAVASGGSFASGTDFVPRDMIAMVHAGEAIVPAAQNRSGGKSGNVIHIHNYNTIMPGATRESADQAATAQFIATRRAVARIM